MYLRREKTEPSLTVGLVPADGRASSSSEIDSAASTVALNC